jgi:hypothetical protein
MVSPGSRTTPRPGSGSALRTSNRLIAVGLPYAVIARAFQRQAVFLHAAHVFSFEITDDRITRI